MGELNYYTGIGSRNVPIEILNKIFKIGATLALKKFILRSGGAEGSDTYFEKGCDSECGLKEIYLPWKNFNGNKSIYYNNFDNFKEAYNIAAKFHPNWKYLKDSVRRLHTRNVYQVLGKDLKTLSKFVICYSSGSGGTTQALRIAKNHNIPIFNYFGINDFVVQNQFEKFFAKNGGN